MPIFDHHCRDCGHTWEAFVHNSAHNPPCTYCGGETIHVIVPPVTDSDRDSKKAFRMRPPDEIKKRVTGDICELNKRLLEVSNRLAIQVQRHSIAKTPQGRILVALFKKAVNTFRGVQLLKSKRLIEESWILLRVLLETHINLIYFLKNDATELTRRWVDASILEKLKYLREVNFCEGTGMAHLVHRKKWEQLEAKIKLRYSEREFKTLKKHGYSGLSLQQRADTVGLGAKYQNLYRIASRSIHTFDPVETGMMDYIKNDEELGNELLASRREALESAQNMLLGRLSLILSNLIEAHLIQGDLWLLGLGYEKYRDKVDGQSTTLDAADPETFYVWRE